MQRKVHIPNKIIILGGNHHNGLGIIRSLGEVGCKVYFVAVGVTKSFASKSKYIENHWFINHESDLLDLLLGKFGNNKIKPIIIPSDDATAVIIDKHINKLINNFIFPNINDEENAILKQMSKNKMDELAKKHGFMVPKGCVLRLNELDKVRQHLGKFGIKHPCIVKPLQSVDGSKNDIKVSHDNDELIVILNELKESYVNVYIQEFIKKEGEVGVQGISTNKGRKVIIPGMVNKIRDSTVSPGSTTYAKITKSNENINFEKSIALIKSLIKDLKFEGIFDLELMYSKEHLYFIELNFRNGAYGYAYTKAGVNMPALWCLDAIGKEKVNESITIQKEITLMSEIADFKNILSKRVNCFRWVYQFLSSDVHLIFNKRDIKPLLYKFLYR